MDDRAASPLQPIDALLERLDALFMVAPMASGDFDEAIEPLVHPIHAIAQTVDAIAEAVDTIAQSIDAFAQFSDALIRFIDPLIYMREATVHVLTQIPHVFANPTKDLRNQVHILAVSLLRHASPLE